MALNIQSKELELVFSTETPSMHDLYSEPCSRCGEDMQVGDYVCWGFCYKCYEKEVDGNRF